MEDNVNEVDISDLLKWPIEDGLPPLYSNVFASFLSPKEVVILFGSFIPTGITFHSEEEQAEYFKSPTIQPLAKIVLSIDAFKKFYDMLTPRMNRISAQEKKNDNPE